MFVVQKTTHYGDYRETLTVEGETKGEAFKNALAAGAVGYAIVFDEANPYHKKALRNFLDMGRSADLGWSTLILLDPVTATDVAREIRTGLINGKQRTIERAEETPDLSIIVADPTGPNGQREFLVSVREVNAENTYTPGENPLLDAALADLAALLTKEN